MPDLSGYPWLARTVSFAYNLQVIRHASLFTFKMEQHIGLIVLEHLRDKLNVHI